MNGYAELLMERRRLLSKLTGAQWVAASHQLEPGDTAAYVRDNGEAFHTDHECHQFNQGSGNITVYPLYFARGLWSADACGHCVLPEGSS